MLRGRQFPKLQLCVLLFLIPMLAWAICFGSYLFGWKGIYRIFGIVGGWPTEAGADTYLYYAWSRCLSAGIDMYSGSTCEDVVSTNATPALLVTLWLIQKISFNQIIGMWLLIPFTYGLVLISTPFPKHNSSPIIVLLLMFSPAFMFQFNGGNSEFLILFCVTLFSIALLRQSFWVGATAITAASLLKIFPITGFFALWAAHVRPTSDKSIRMQFIFFLILTLCILFSWRDLANQIALSTTYGRENVFGLPTHFSTLNDLTRFGRALIFPVRWASGAGKSLGLKDTQIYFIGSLAISSLTTFVGVFLGWKNRRLNIPAGLDWDRAVFFLVGTSLLIPLVGISWSWGYRFAYILLCLPLSLSIEIQSRKRSSLKWINRVFLFAALAIPYLGHTYFTRSSNEVFIFKSLLLFWSQIAAIFSMAFICTYFWGQITLDSLQSKSIQP